FRKICKFEQIGELERNIIITIFSTFWIISLFAYNGFQTWWLCSILLVTCCLLQNNPQTRIDKNATSYVKHRYRLYQ
ncbi:MAG: hypothetical protein AAF195_01850, partial [Pseudomonadota bacterium]